MARFHSLEWYKKHPEVIVRHHGERWSDLHIYVLRLLFNNQEPLHEMTRMLGRTEYGVLAQLHRQGLIWYNNHPGRAPIGYYRKGWGFKPYNGRDFR